MMLGPVITVVGAFLAVGFLLMGREWFSMGGLMMTALGIATSAGCAVSQVLRGSGDDAPEPPPPALPDEPGTEETSLGAGARRLPHA